MRYETNVDNNSVNDFVINMKWHKFKPLMCLLQMNIAIYVGANSSPWLGVKMAIIINWIAHGLA